jgi:hypothetical protein
MKISPDYIAEVENFLAQIMSERYPNMNFGPHSNARDLIIRPLATVFAIMQAEIAQTKDILNLFDLQKGSFDNDLTNAVYRMVRNWFIEPKQAVQARGTAYFEVSSKTTIRIPPETKLYIGGKEYTIDSTVPIVFSPTELKPQYDINGNVVKYITPPFNIISVLGGSAYNLSPGTTFDYVVWEGNNLISAKTATGVFGGIDRESPQSCIERTKASLVSRNLLSKNSIKTSIMNDFPLVRKVEPIGYEDYEMVRNKIELPFGGSISCYRPCDDIYISKLANTVVYETTVGGVYNRKGGIYECFNIQDAPNNPFNLRPGIDKAYVVIRPNTTTYNVFNSLGYPTTFVIEKVLANNSFLIKPGLPQQYLNIPSTDWGIKYSNRINWSMPFDASISNVMHWNNHVMVPVPVLLIEKVEIRDPNNINDTIELTQTFDTPDEKSYRIYVPDPLLFNSYDSFVFLELHPTHDGKPAIVTYKTFSLDDVANYIFSDDRKIIAINRVLRAHYFIDLKCTIQYVLKPNSRVDIEAVKKSLANYINSFDLGVSTLTTDKIVAFLLQNYNAFDEIQMVTFSYSIMLPDGHIITDLNASKIDLSGALFHKYRITPRICDVQIDKSDIIMYSGVLI